MAKCGCRETLRRSTTKKVLIISIILTDLLLRLRVIIKKVLKVIKISEIVTKLLLKKY